MGVPRRMVASKYLNGQKVITPEILYETINLPGVKAITNDTTLY